MGQLRAVLSIGLVALLPSFGIDQPPRPSGYSSSQSTGSPSTKPGTSVWTADPVRPVDLVTIQRGTIPIIITAPHGGSVRVPGSRDRAKGVTVRDVNTAEIAQLVAQRLTAQLGAKPYVVVAQFSRKDADANRAPDEAYENDAAKTQYDAFHGAVRAFIDECRRDHTNAILIDLHGQVREPKAIVRGTRNGQTVSALLKRHGQPALAGPKSIFGALKAAKYDVLPDIDAGKADEPEPGVGRETFFDGGYIVAHYGSQNADGIDAIQIELGAMRSDRPWQTSRDLADAIAGFYRAFVAPEGKAEPVPSEVEDAAPAVR
jgi:N-formylglutamate amidohydrolase